MERDRDDDSVHGRTTTAAVPAQPGSGPRPSAPGEPAVRQDVLELYKLAVEMAEPPWYVSVAVAMGGVTLSLAWWLQLRSYRHLNAAKFLVINDIEEQLPVRIFTDEWAVLRGAPEPRRTRRYAELSSSERIVPLVFALAHVVLVAGTLSG